MKPKEERCVIDVRVWQETPHTNEANDDESAQLKKDT
jgi:hypothetical protein